MGNRAIHSLSIFFSVSAKSPQLTFMSLFGVLELELADEVDVSPGLDFGPLGTQEDILEVQLDVVANVRHPHTSVQNSSAKSTTHSPSSTSCR